eukprot:TRINITY_DN38209_c0_g1_i1.p1 TRINITY_DN38209_c0_g1~~TRINITY_DN38209_c0_g1_i1.p1  ORF type:complete len:256 (-),score=-2.66 TRINITY_DN38209_c0_g1_i1:154-921(-)
MIKSLWKQGLEWWNNTSNDEKNKEKKENKECAEDFPPPLCVWLKQQLMHKNIDAALFIEYPMTIQEPHRVIFLLEGCSQHITFSTYLDFEWLELDNKPDMDPDNLDDLWKDTDHFSLRQWRSPFNGRHLHMSQFCTEFGTMKLPLRVVDITITQNNRRRHGHVGPSTSIDFCMLLQNNSSVHDRQLCKWVFMNHPRWEKDIPLDVQNVILAFLPYRLGTHFKDPYYLLSILFWPSFASAFSESDMLRDHRTYHSC